MRVDGVIQESTSDTNGLWPYSIELECSEWSKQITSLPQRRRRINIAVRSMAYDLENDHEAINTGCTDSQTAHQGMTKQD